MPYFSFVLLCYNNSEITFGAIDSFLRNLSYEHLSRGIELIIVDNGSVDDTGVKLKEFMHSYKGEVEIIIFNLEKNLGYIMGVNTGLSKVRGEIITVFSNDVVFCPHWFDGLASILENDHSVGAAAPFLTNGSGEENIKLEFKTPGMSEAFYKSKETMDFYAEKIMEARKDTIIYTNRLVGACFSIKKKVLELVGGLDFWFGLGIFDDDDFSLRVNIAGYKTAIVGRSFVYHEGSATMNKDKSSSNAAVISNKKKFLRKWKIKCLENTEGLYGTRDDVIKNTPYKTEIMFFPLSKNQHNPSPQKLNEGNCEVKRLFIAADWINYKSRYLEKLDDVLSNKDTSTEIYLWVPNTYFSLDEVKRIIEIYLKSRFSGYEELFKCIKFINDDISPVDLLVFLSFFDTIIIVDNDYVNKQIINLASQINISVQ